MYTLALALACLAPCAPAPLPKAPPPPPPEWAARLAPGDLTGEWSLRWAGARWRMDLTAFGRYRCWCEGSDSEWLGTWRLDGEGRLVVEERCFSPQGAGAEWCWYVEWGPRVSRVRPRGQARWAPDGRIAASVALERRAKR